ncbi:isoflavone reductase [Xylariales sp. AK1849]|nr:isoflavone reductase [Xylariales sp. AK1849]
MSTPIKVLVISATGKTGKSVVEGLLSSSTKYDILALTRESSLGNPVLQEFRDRGVKIATTRLLGPRQDLVDLLTGIEVVISCIFALNLDDQLPLITAAKEAGVKRFVPCNFGTPAPRGVMTLLDHKEDILAAVQRAYLPYTVIDVGWWSQAVVPAVPSERTKQWISPFFKDIPGDGTARVAFTDLPDVGTYVAKIIEDPRTLNQKVFAYTEVLTSNEVVDLMSEVSGEKATATYRPADEIHRSVEAAKEILSKDPNNQQVTMDLFINEYLDSWGLRADNTPEAAEYLGYLDFKKLYPEVKGISMRELFESILDGSARPTA